MANENEKVEKAIEPKANLTMTTRGFEPTDMESAYRYAKVISLSDYATPMYKDNEANCMLLLDVSMRMKVPWLMLMQHMYIVHERPALDSTISTALVNMSGEFVDPIEYEVEGKEARDKDYRVRAFAKRKTTGTVLYGPWIDWPLVRGEAWDAKSGSKWKTMPDQMFHYRAASWFQRRYCPELTMGMMTPEEAYETPRKKVNSTTVDEDKSTVDRIKDKFEKTTEPEKPKEQIKEPDQTEKPAPKKGKKTTKKKEKPKTEPKTPPDQEEPPQEPETEKKEEVQEHEPEGEPTTVGKDKYKCLRCERQFPEHKNEKCPFCMGQVTELQ